MKYQHIAHIFGVFCEARSRYVAFEMIAQYAYPHQTERSREACRQSVIERHGDCMTDIIHMHTGPVDECKVMLDVLLESYPATKAFGRYAV